MCFIIIVIFQREGSKMELPSKRGTSWDQVDWVMTCNFYPSCALFEYSIQWLLYDQHGFISSKTVLNLYEARYCLCLGLGVLKFDNYQQSVCHICLKTTTRWTSNTYVPYACIWRQLRRKPEEKYGDDGKFGREHNCQNRYFWCLY